jgi:hypothetical protein
MIGPRPVLPARGLISLTVIVLPSDARDRYREEFGSELSELGALAQISQASSLLFGSIPLRQALRERDVILTAQVKNDWRCRIGRHHYFGVQDDNPEMRGRGYLRCIRCGKPKDPPTYGVMPPTALGRGGG